jgi:hypothetical protein
MRRLSVSLLVTQIVLYCALSAFGQQPAATTVRAAVPPLVNFNGTLRDVNSKPMNDVIGVTFLLYRDSEGGAPLWIETQNVRPDKAGHYSVVLGSTKTTGLPTDLFASGEARWLGVQVEGQPEQPRVLLVAVPYALKAADAETLGGKPLSAFMLAPPSAPSQIASQPSSNPSSGSSTSVTDNRSTQAPITGGGTTNFVPLWTSSTKLGNSILFQNPAKNVGIGNTSPAAKLDVSGGAFVRGALKLPATGTATSQHGFNSNPLDLTASSFNGQITQAIDETFRWQTEPVGNNTTNPLGKLNLLFAQGTLPPVETGLSLSTTGDITATTASLTAKNNSQVLSLTQNGTGAALTASSATSNGIVGQTTGAGRQSGVLGIGGSGSSFSIGVQGQAQSSNGTGVLGLSTGTTGIGASGKTTGSSGIGVAAAATSASGVTQALFARVFSPAGIAGTFDNAGGGKILSARNNGVEKFSVDGNGNVTANNVVNGVTAGTGLTGGGTNGVVNMSLATNCASGQVLKWNGSSWICSNTGLGTVTSVGTGAGLVGGPITTTGTVSIDPNLLGTLAFVTTGNEFQQQQQFDQGANVVGYVNINPGGLQIVQGCENCEGLNIKAQKAPAAILSSIFPWAALQVNGNANINGTLYTGAVSASGFVSASGGVVSGLNTVVFSPTPAFDASLGNTQRLTLTANVTSSTLINGSYGQQLNFILCQDSVGGHSFVFPTGFHSPGTISSAANSCSVQAFILATNGDTVFSLSPMQTGQ